MNLRDVKKFIKIVREKLVVCVARNCRYLSCEVRIVIVFKYFNECAELGYDKFRVDVNTSRAEMPCDSSISVLEEDCASDKPPYFFFLIFHCSIHLSTTFSAHSVSPILQF